MILADLPGYGHAVASTIQMKKWNQMIRDYLGNREVLSQCCILVDCSRGLCAEDISLIKFLIKQSKIIIS